MYLTCVGDVAAVRTCQPGGTRASRFKAALGSSGFSPGGLQEPRTSRWQDPMSGLLVHEGPAGANGSRDQAQGGRCRSVGHTTAQTHCCAARDSLGGGGHLVQSATDHSRAKDAAGAPELSWHILTVLVLGVLC